MLAFKRRVVDQFVLFTSFYYMSYGHFFQFRISFSGSALPGNKDNERLSEKLLIFDFDGILGINGKTMCYSRKNRSETKILRSGRGCVSLWWLCRDGIL